MRDVERAKRNCRTYGMAGAVLGIGAPLGLLALRRFAARQPARGWLSAELRSGRLTYGYLAASTMAVFALFGRVLGRHADALIASHCELERLREEFAAVIAHDLRGPIQTLRMQTDLLLERARNGDVRVSMEELHRLSRSSRRLGAMVGDLLDASRIEAHRLALDPESIVAAEAVRDLVDRMHLNLGKHSVDIRVEGTPPSVRVDPGRFDQILANLLDNAAKYSPESAPIEVTIGGAADGAKIALADHGMGIGREDLPRLFDRFYQSKRAREQKSGLGLGLYITKGLVEAHGGRISVASEPGQGSTFTLWFPRA